MELDGRKIPKVDHALTGADRLGAFRVRWGIGRYDYLVVPGLYAIGNPGPESPVLVTANYKLSFDTLRENIVGVDAFILVLETMGINVWCAAGKGTFGTQELSNRISSTDLASLVSHRQVIVPQLGAPGVSAHLVKKSTGFRVKWGPVEARDISDYLDAGMRATEVMRRKFFPIGERADLVPMELVPSLKYGVIVMIALVALGGLASIINDMPFIEGLSSQGFLAAVGVSTGIFCGTILVPLLLPVIPGRAFAVKGAWTAATVGLGLLVATTYLLKGALPLFELAGLALLSVSISSFLAMNFTGSSTYTSLSGVEKEMKVAVPLQAGAFVVGLVTWGVGVFILSGGGS